VSLSEFRKFHAGKRMNRHKATERFEKSSALIFLSNIFLLSKPKQENVGEENAEL
jgi:hypothetical protein